MQNAAAPARRRWRALLLLLSLVALGLTAAVWYGWRTWTGEGPMREARTVVVPRGATLAAIGGTLESAGIIADGRAFLVAALVTRAEGALRAGEFAVPAQASLRTVLDVLRTARPVQRRLTIPEGLTAVQLTSVLERTEGLSGSADLPAEGSILPETYAFEWGDTRQAVLVRARAAMERALAQAWAERAENLPLNSPRELLILASIVERETAREDERARVAGVFVNRLRRNMPLQSDPTVVYAISAGRGVMERPLSRADLDADHPFNTYRNRGLPPGPIASPGRAALIAAARPQATDDLFFVADGTGGHAFARTLEEHNRNVSRWREIERQRGTRTN